MFEAFVNPDITTKFWFTKGSGRLEAGKQVQWDWEMYGISIPVTVKAIEPNKRIVIEWPGYGGPTTVEWIFAPQEDGTTFVSITEERFYRRRGRTRETGDRLDARVLVGARGPQGAARARRQTESRGGSLPQGDRRTLIRRSIVVLPPIVIWPAASGKDRLGRRGPASRAMVTVANCLYGVVKAKGRGGRTFRHPDGGQHGDV